MSDKPRWEIIHGDSLTVLESFPPSTFDAVITDPPYASGGRTQAEKSKATAKKYSSMGGNAPPVDPLGGRVAVPCQTRSQTRRAGLYVH